MKHFHAAALKVIALFLAVATSLQAATEKGHPNDVAKGEKIALGRPYSPRSAHRRGPVFLFSAGHIVI